MKTKAESKIYARECLADIIKNEKQKNRKIVFTNGCFDILHIGHVQYLAEAKNLGDILIVAVNDDGSVKRLKGETRPINKVYDRMLLLAHLECVDYVVSFGEDRAINTIKMLLPHVYTKGGDMILNDIIEKDTVEEYGGEVRVLSLTKGYSSTNIIKKISSHN